MQRKNIVVGVLVIIACLLVLSPVMDVFAQAQVVHIVQPGENLFLIALYYGTTVDGIIQANGLGSVYIYVGQKLIIPAATNTTTPDKPLTPPTDAPGCGLEVRLRRAPSIRCT